MIEIIICDDQKNITTHLSELVQGYIEQWQTPTFLKSFQSGERLIKYLDHAEPKKRIILLDIEMAKLSGLDVAIYIRNTLKDYISEIIFVTGTSGYERELFQVRPSGFIAKPINSTKLFDTLNKVYEQLGMNQPFFSYNQNRVNKSIRLDGILYFESSGRKIKVVTHDYDDWFYEKMTPLRRRLTEYPQFVSCHRSFIVNVKHVTRKEGSNLVMSNGLTISVSANKIASLEQTLLRYF